MEPQILDLVVLGQVNVASRPVAPAVLPHNGRRVGGAAQAAQAGKGDADAVALGVVGRIRLQKRVSGDDAANVAEA